jgi:pimeloyl-ACP methyl ester carboxylesterase
MSAVTIDNDLVHYEVLGRGRPVILLHGWMNSWRYWVPSMQQLSMKYRTYALDLWGYGDSSKDDARLTLDAHVELLGNFMDKLGIAKAAFVGHSLGAAVMVRFSLKNPGRVARLMAISPPVFESALERRLAAQPAAQTPGQAQPSSSAATSSGPDERAGTPVDDQATRPIVAPQGNSTVLRRPSGMEQRPSTGQPLTVPEFKSGAPSSQPPDPGASAAPQKADVTGTAELDPAANPLRVLLAQKTVSELLAEHLSKETPDYERLIVEAAKTSRNALDVSMMSFDRVDLVRDMRRMTTPTLLIHGENDRFLPPPSDKLATYLIGGKTNFRCEVVPEANHFPMLTDPANFHRLMMDFLEAQDLAALVLQKERWVRKVR